MVRGPRATERDWTRSSRKCRRWSCSIELTNRSRELVHDQRQTGRSDGQPRTRLISAVFPGPAGRVCHRIPRRKSYRMVGRVVSYAQRGVGQTGLPGCGIDARNRRAKSIVSACGPSRRCRRRIQRSERISFRQIQISSSVARTDWSADQAAAKVRVRAAGTSH